VHLLLLIALLGGEAWAQEQEPVTPEWPDPGSEEPGGPRLFPAEPTNDEDGDGELDVEVPESLAEPTYRYSWYGWRNLIGDGLALILAASAVPTQLVPLLIAGGVTYAIGGPIAHFTAGNWGRALISFGMRIAGPVLVGLGAFGLTCAIDSGCSSDDSTLVISLIGTAVGAFVAAGLDVGLVAREQVEVKVAVTPAIGSVPHGPKTFGLAVQF
jgi:hypothetical protein